MVLVRMTFECQWGRTQQVVDAMKQGMDVMRRIQGPDVRVRLLTDLSGPFNTLVQEIEVASLAEWERGRAALFSSPEFQQMQAEMGPEVPFLSGRTEFYTIEKNFDE